MTALFWMLLIPICGIFFMVGFGRHRFAGIFNVLFCAGMFVAAICLTHSFLSEGVLISTGQDWYIDALSILAILLTTFILLTTSFFSKDYMVSSFHGRKITQRRLHFYHVMYQMFAFLMLLTLTTNNLGILWVAMEGSTLSTVLLVGLYRTPEAIEAAWKYFILCIMGIALALFGTVLVYASSYKLMGTAHSGILWSVLHTHAFLLNKDLMKLAFVFLLVGYGTKIAWVPLHNWLPYAYSESPAPMSALLSGLMLNLPLYAILRFKILVDLSLQTSLSNQLLMGFGLLSFLVASFMLLQQRNIKRLLGYSSIEHMGIITFSFGLGTPMATYAGLFYLWMHSLAKSALFMNVGCLSELGYSQQIEKIRGVLTAHPKVGWGFLLGIFALCGVPLFGIFSSEWMVVWATLQQAPIFIVVLLLGFGVAVSGMFAQVQPMIYGVQNVPSPFKGGHSSLVPVFLHLFLLMGLGLYVPASLSHLLQEASALLGGKIDFP